MIGHGIGIELNELPIISEKNHSELPDGCVVTLDMHIIDKNAGVAKSEDVIVMTQKGNEILTKSPRQLFEI